MISLGPGHIGLDTGWRPPWQPQVAIEKWVFPDQLQLVAVKMTAKALVMQG